MSFKLILDPVTATATIDGLTVDEVDGLIETITQFQSSISLLQSEVESLRNPGFIEAAIAERLRATSQQIEALRQQLTNLTPASIQAASSSELIATIQQVEALWQQLTNLTPASIRAASSSELAAVSQRVVALQQQLAGISPVSIGAASSTELEAANQRIAAFQQQLANNLPDRQYILWGYGKVLKGATFLQTSVSSSPLFYFAFQNPHALDDEIEISFPLKSGSYILDVFQLRQTNSGIIQMHFNGTQLGGNIDKYNSSIASLISRFNVSVPNSGLQTFRSKVIGRNAASSGFANQIAAIVLSPQG